ncbi:MAG: hypothetical protein ACM3WV_09255, partial [Bacillota bacterium]
MKNRQMPVLYLKPLVLAIAVCAVLLAAAGLTAYRPGSGSEVYAATYPGRLGVGISLPERGGTYVDCARLTRWWQAPNLGASFTAGDVDENGWPLKDCCTVLFDWRPVAEWTNQIDDPDVYRLDVSGTYKI